MTTPDYVQALNSLRAGVFILDQNDRCIYANPAFGELVGTLVENGRFPAREQFWPTCASAAQCGAEFMTSFVVARGGTLSVRVFGADIGSGHRFFRVRSALSDDVGVESLHEQRLEALGTMAGGIAHDFNNILAGILGHVSYLKAILPANGPHVESLKAIEGGSRKGSSMTQQILTFSRLDSKEASRVDLSELAKGTCMLLKAAINPSCTFTWSAPVEPPVVLASEGKLAQVLVNLVMNARDAVKADGRITVAVDTTEDATVLDRVFKSTERGVLRYVTLSVSDNGHGMTDDVKQRIFDPYFSTKKRNGTGLGLATVAQIVREYGGAIELQSEPSKGTTVTVYLPLIDVVATSSSVMQRGAAEGPQLARGTERILVIDDEYAVRNVILLSLQHLGYEVEIAESGAEGIAKYKAAKTPYSLVMLDMLMPQLSGEEVFFKLREFDPNAPVLIMSGFTSEQSIHRVMRGGGLGFLQKPFTIDELAKRLRELFDEGEG